MGYGPLITKQPLGEDKLVHQHFQTQNTKESSIKMSCEIDVTACRSFTCLVHLEEQVSKLDYDSETE